MSEKRNLTKADLTDIELRIENAILNAHDTNQKSCQDIFDMRYKKNGVHSPTPTGEMFDGGSTPNTEVQYPFYHPYKLLKTSDTYWLLGLIATIITAYLKCKGVIDIGG